MREPRDNARLEAELRRKDKEIERLEKEIAEKTELQRQLQPMAGPEAMGSNVLKIVAVFPAPAEAEIDHGRFSARPGPTQKMKTTATVSPGCTTGSCLPHAVSMHPQDRVLPIQAWQTFQRSRPWLQATQEVAQAERVQESSATIQPECSEIRDGGQCLAGRLKAAYLAAAGNNNGPIQYDACKTHRKAYSAEMWQSRDHNRKIAEVRDSRVDEIRRCNEQVERKQQESEQIG